MDHYYSEINTTISTSESNNIVTSIENLSRSTTEYTRWGNETYYNNTYYGNDTSKPSSCTIKAGTYGYYYDDTYWYVDSINNLVLKDQICEVCQAYNGSLLFSFKDIDLNDVDKFLVIPGQLDTEKCANGDYADVAIPVIFNQLKNYIYPHEIFDNIRNTLAAFFPSIALEQLILADTLLLSEKLYNDEITIEQYNESLKIDYSKFASDYVNYYNENYVKLQIAIDKYKYLLDNKIVKK